MPDLTPGGPVPPLNDPFALPQYRVSGYYADSVHPPQVSGELAVQYEAYDELGRDESVEALAGRTDLSKILVERKVAAEFNAATTNSQWQTERTWTKNDDGDGWTHT